MDKTCWFLCTCSNRIERSLVHMNTHWKIFSTSIYYLITLILSYFRKKNPLNHTFEKKKNLFVERLQSSKNKTFERYTRHFKMIDTWCFNWKWSIQMIKIWRFDFDIQLILLRNIKYNQFFSYQQLFQFEILLQIQLKKMYAFSEQLSVGEECLYYVFHWLFSQFAVA